MENGFGPLFSLFGMPVTAYALCLAVSLAAGLFVFFLRCRKLKIGEDTAWLAALLALPMGLLGARAFYCAVRLNLYLETGLKDMLRLWDGGYGLWGAVGGAGLAGVIAARAKKEKPSRILDAMAPSGALIIGLCRFAEYFSGEGVGMAVESPTLQFFPLAVYNDYYEEWFYAVFMLEGLAALVIFAVLIGKRRGKGRDARLFLILYSACQVLLESLRRDGFLRWLFVRVSQLTAAVLLALLMIAAVIRWVRSKEKRRFTAAQLILCWAVVLAGAGISIAMEFSVDGKILVNLPVWTAYLIMALCCAGMGTAAYQTVFHSVKE